jgi:hypothetical protein
MCNILSENGNIMKDEGYIAPPKGYAIITTCHIINPRHNNAGELSAAKRA